MHYLILDLPILSLTIESPPLMDPSQNYYLLKKKELVPGTINLNTVRDHHEYDDNYQ